MPGLRVQLCRRCDRRLGTRAAWSPYALSMNYLPRAATPATDAVRGARDFLLHNVYDYEKVMREFRWPELEEFTSPSSGSTSSRVSTPTGPR